MKPEFILVSGANATGKTTLIERNRTLLETTGFQIIIPDNILKYATSHTDVSSVIKEHVNDALSIHTNFVLEIPFQFEGMVKTLNEIEEAGYRMSMYQVFVKDASESADRVQQRIKTGGLFINSDEVKLNFDANLKNVAANYGRFDHIYFIDNSTNKGIKLAAEFAKGKLIRLHASDNISAKIISTKECV